MEFETSRYWKMRVFLSLFVGYALYYFTRKSFIYVMPGMIADLGYDKGELGLMGTLFAVAYGTSKFFSGIISDKSNPRYFMAIGLILTGVLNICFGFSSSILLFTLIWALNGWFQGFGWPPCVKYLTYCYPQTERGSWWSTWTVSQNVGSFLIPWIVGGALYLFGWRFGIMLPGIISILGGLFLLLALPDLKVTAEDKKTSFVFSVLKNRHLWILGMAYFFVYLVRTGFSDWVTLYLIEKEGYTPFTASGLASFFEVGGFFGGFSCGWISDRLFQAKRGPANLLFALSLIVFLPLFCYFPQPLLLFLVGFAIFGPQVLIGIAAAELVDKNSTATATGLIGWIAYLGSAFAGYPLGKVIDIWGWEGFFSLLFASSILSFLLLIPSLRPYESDRSKWESPARTPKLSETGSKNG